jgi:cytochrome c peroxidase
MTRSKATLLLGSVLTLGGALPLRAADWQTLPDRAPSPADNPTSEAKVQLGKMVRSEPMWGPIAPV